MREFVEAYLSQKNLIEHQLNSYNDFIDNLPRLIKSIRIGSRTPEPGVIAVPLQKMGAGTIYIFIEDVWVDNPFNPKVPKFLKDRSGRSVESMFQELSEKLRYDKAHHFGESSTDKILTIPPIPMICRIRKLTYSSPIKAIVRVYFVPPQVSLEDLKQMRKEGTADQYQLRFEDTIPVETTDGRIIEGNIITIGEIPIMLRSKLCWLHKDNVTKFLKINEGNLLPSGGKLKEPIPDELYERVLAEYFMEDPKDPGGYFIINGSERVLIPTEELAPNRIFVEVEKKSGKTIEVAKVYSHKEDYKARISVEKAPDGVLYVTLPKSKFKGKIPLMVMLKALGLTDKEIYDLMAYSPETSLIVNLNLEYVNEKLKVRNVNEAIRYLAEKYFGGQSLEARIEAVNNYLDRDFLAHISDVASYMHRGVEISSEALRKILRHEKGKYLAHMGRRVLRLAAGEIPVDDKDHYSNKRLKLARELLTEVIKQALRAFISDLANSLDKKFVDAKVLDEKLIRNQEFAKFTNPNAFTQKVLHHMATGAFPGRRTGVSQIVERTSYLATLGILRRVKSMLKRDQPHFEARELHPTQWGRLCPNETPEGQNCGLVKNLALGADISRNVRKGVLFKALKMLGIRPVVVETPMPTVYANNLPMGVVAGDLERFREVISEIKSEILVKARIFDRLESVLEGTESPEDLNSTVRMIVSDVVGAHFTRELLETVSKLPETSYSKRALSELISAINELVFGMIKEAEQNDEILDIIRHIVQEIIVNYDNIESIEMDFEEAISSQGFDERYPTIVRSLRKLFSRDMGYLLSQAKEALTRFLSDVILVINGTERPEYYELIFARIVTRILDMYAKERISKEEAYRKLKEERQRVVEIILESIMRIMRPNENLETGSSEYAKYYHRALSTGQYLKAYVIKEITDSEEIHNVIMSLIEITEKNEDIKISELFGLVNALLDAYDNVITRWKRAIISETLKTIKSLRRHFLSHIKKLSKGFKEFEIEQINVRYDEATDEIYILADSGRIRRPLISVNTLVRRALIEDLYRQISQQPERLKVTSDVHARMFFKEIVLEGLITYVLPNDVIDTTLKTFDALNIPWDSNEIEKMRDQIETTLRNILESILSRIRLFGKPKIKPLADELEKDKDVIVKIVLDYISREDISIRELALRELNNIRKDLKERKVSWRELIKNGIVEYIDADEEENLYVALYPEDLGDEHTHIEVDPLLILGLSASLIPFPEHNASPRNVYGANMMRQAIGFPFANFKYRPDTRQHVMFYPEKPIVRSIVSKYIGFERRPAGQNFVVAIISYEGYNMQDAIIFNKGALERGLARSMFLKTYEAEEMSYGTPEAKDEIINPMNEEVRRRYQLIYRPQEEAYSKLDEDGIARVGSRLKGSYVVIGKISPERFGGEQIGIRRIDNSTKLSSEEFGVVDTVYVMPSPENVKNMLVRVKVRSHMVPEIGDKFASRHGQKGVIGLIVPEEDMPFTEDGIVPDVIFNPHAIPSRKTVGHILEMLAGKVGALIGEEIDGTPFSGTNEEWLREMLKKLGFSYRGVEVLYDGRTGKRFLAEIYMGVIYYQRLHHLVEDKIHARSRGPVQILTKQPTEGKSRHGGLRFGEMEKDCLIGHGAAMALKDRLLDESDKTIIYVCAKCGNIADEQKVGNTTRVFCRVCGNTEDIYPVEVSYAFKLLLDELKSLLIFPRLRVGERL